ncbi:BQ2448_1795 [Microbotryum intermedium]|uniref:BQ2448_1795 protein n=1 Tax=Microbotryum intermedium TaxID=269621 RepID=A0A238FE71_9BASI|nr:BQ2448_1795 [Microbotryum intermedium]
MASFLSWLPCCPSHADQDEVNERTALLNHDILPEAPVEQIAGRSTEEQQAQQDYLRAIIDAACAQVLPSLFTPPPPPISLAHTLLPHPTPGTEFTLKHWPIPKLTSDLLCRIPSTVASSSPASPSSSRSPSPLPSPSPSPARRPSQADWNGGIQSQNRRTSDWRPPMDHDSDTTRLSSSRTGGGPFREESSDEDGKRVMRLDATFGLGVRARGAARPPSTHSLKTLPRSFARGQDGSVRGSPLARGRTEEQEEEEEEDGMGQDDDDDDDDDAKFDTYRTAKESNDEGVERVDSRPSTRRSCSGSARLPVRDVFTAQDGNEAELQQAIKDLEASMKTFKLQPVGPIIADIHG